MFKVWEALTRHGQPLIRKVVMIVKANYLKNLTLITQVGLMMLIPIFLCLFFGIWLDDRFATNGVFTIIFIIVGVLAGFRNMFVIVLKDIDKGKKDYKHGKK